MASKELTAPSAQKPRRNLLRRTSSFENLQPQTVVAANHVGETADLVAMVTEETAQLLPPSAAAVVVAVANSSGSVEAASNCFPRRRLLRRNSSTPCFSGNYSKVAYKLGKYVDECVYHAFKINDQKGREQCVNHVTEVLQAEILQPVQNDLLIYGSDLNFERFDFSNARLILSNLEYRVATLRDRLLYPFRYQQVMDLSHLCGCIHSVRMRLGFLGRQKPSGAVSVA